MARPAAVNGRLCPEVSVLQCKCRRLKGRHGRRRHGSDLAFVMPVAVCVPSTGPHANVLYAHYMSPDRQLRRRNDGTLVTEQSAPPPVPNRPAEPAARTVLE